MSNEWHPFSWESFEAAQQPPWPESELKTVVESLQGQPPLVFAQEVRDLRSHLANVCAGQAFLLQGGDCAEQFSDSGPKTLKSKLRILLQMAAVLTYAGLKPVVKVGRIAGQYGKPRSSATEKINGEELLTYRGDAVNALDETGEARRANPQRLLQAYYQSAATLNLLRAFTHGGFADLNMVHRWNQDFVEKSPMGHEYGQIAEDIAHALRFMEVCGISSSNHPQLHQVDFFTSHEALLLPYEAGLTRIDSEYDKKWYDTSAHMLWIGDRTRQVDGAHIEFMRGIHNPIGVKVGPTCKPDMLKTLIERLNPENEKGRLVLITRFGADSIREYLPSLINAVKAHGAHVIWSCDPMHGNTYKASSGHKTRHFDQILSELAQFFTIHGEKGTIPGGVHFELTGEAVTECVGGSHKLTEDDLHQSYNTACDPRLNAKQSLDIAFRISEHLRNLR